MITIVDNYFFTKCIDKVFDAATYLNPEWLQRGKLNGIAYHITPQSAVGADDQCVIGIQLNFSEV
ncbi:hypothetical protein D9M68_857430 [compost metagenome]